MKTFLVRIPIVIFLISVSFSLVAQRTVAYEPPTYEFNTALELFKKEKYGPAQRYFQFVYENTAEMQQDIKANSYFYIGVCATYLYNEDADFLLKDFIRRYPVDANIPEAYFYLGKFYFYKKQYKKVIECFDQLDERVVKEENLAEYKFKKGYAYFEAGDFVQAKYWFNSARKDEGQYRLRAIYYSAHIAYDEKQYEAALEDFLLLKDEPAYQEAVPFYITQIYFIQGRYQELVETAPALLGKASEKRYPEINRSIALSYYNLGNYKEALPYFTDFLSVNKEKLVRNDNYAIGYTWYQNKKYKEAIDYLSLTTDTLDVVAQNSYYIIGDCYMKLENFSLAMQSFFEASKMNFSAHLKEDALYNYAKLQYETSSNPFNGAIKALEQYINEYPNSSRSEEANSYLSSIYLSTKNYQGAINSLEKIKSKSPALLRAYQRCTHFRALELINNGKNKEAIELLDKSMKYPMNPAIQTSNLYWKAECNYRSNDVKQAYIAFQNYYKNNHVKNDDNYPMSFYSFGYAALKEKKYKEAQDAFTTFLTYQNVIQNEDLEADALARLGDAYFMQKNLNSAIRYYEKCESLKNSNADYAIFQQAKCQGYLGNTNKKLSLLEKIIRYYPKSTYCDDAEYEYASTQYAQNNYAVAIESYQNFIKKYPKSNLIRQAYNKLAQAYLNTQQTELAISTFKYVIENYSGSQEAQDALVNLENIYTELGTTGEFFDYIKTRGNINISAGKQDSTLFKSAELKYLRGDCETSVKGFETYLNQYPNGNFAAQAYFYKAECEYGNNSFDKALVGYEAIIRNYRTEYNETALRKAATILYNKKEYSAAMGYYRKLLDGASTENLAIAGNAGIMRSAFELKQYRDAQNAADAIIISNLPDSDLKNEARLFAGRSAYELGDFGAAKKQFTFLAGSSTNDMAAEAAYYLALIEFKQHNYDACEKRITEMLAENYSSEYWFASVFILYGDLYAAKGNYFQAKHTYQSIVDNYEGEELKKIAIEKIEHINELEKLEGN